MKFLFFDTECATCNNGAKLCEFGYVLTDDKFRILKKDNLLINPQARFNVYGFKRAGIKLAYSLETYRKSPTLQQRYPEIKKLLTAKNVLPVGYSCDNDARFMLSDFKRLGLTAFDYNYLDVLELIKFGLKRDKNLSLDAVYADTGGEDISHHEAQHDALMTMEVLKYYLSERGESVKELMKESYAFGEVFEKRIVIGGRPFNYSPSGKMTPQNKRLLTKFIAEKVITEGILEGKTFCFEKDYERDNFPVVIKAADLITDKGGKYTEVISFADFVISPNGYKAGYIHKKKKKSAKIIDLKTLTKMLNVPEWTFSGEIDVDRILAKSEENADWYAAYKKRKNKKYR